VGSAVAILWVAAGVAGAQSPPPAAGVVPTPEQQIAAAVLPLPTELRAAARVLGYTPDKKLVQLRAGTNHMTCLADEPGDDRFHVACYHDGMEPFMLRGRELRASGVKGDAVDSARFREVKAGKIKMPAQGALYTLTGKIAGWNLATGEVTGASKLYVVYIPGATEASTGLSSQPQKGPWIMHPGTPKAHIMFTPDMK
jgi:hypothetical protein